MKSKKLWIFIVLFFVISLIWKQTAFSLDLLEGKLQIGGYLENYSAVRLEDGNADHPGWKAGDVYLFRNTLQVRANYTLSDNLQFYGIYRGWYDAGMDIDGDFRDRIASHVRDNFKSANEMRELYAVYSNPCWILRVGKQQIVWGESDGFRMADLLNPLDLSYHYFFAPWEEIRIPLWGVDAIYKFNLKLMGEFVFLPNSFDRGFGTHKFPAEGSGMAFRFPQYLIDSIRISKGEKSVSNATVAGRIKYNMDNLDLGFFYIHQRFENPVMPNDFVARGGASGVPGDYFVFPFVNRIGATFTYQTMHRIPGFEAPVVRGECVFTVDEPFNGGGQLYTRNTFAYMLGYDANLFNRFLNPNGSSIYHSMQIFQKFIFNKNNQIGLNGFDKSLTTITFYTSTPYFRDTLNPALYACYRTTGTAYINPSVGYKIGNNWRFTLGYQHFWASNKSEGDFGWLNDCDSMYGIFKYTF